MLSEIKDLIQDYSADTDLIAGFGCMGNNEKVQVECYSGYKANERPVAFLFQGDRWEISEILDQWYEGGVEPDRPIVYYFKVKAHGDVFILRYASETDTWSVMFSGLK